MNNEYDTAIYGSPRHFQPGHTLLQTFQLFLAQGYYTQKHNPLRGRAFCEREAWFPFSSSSFVLLRFYGRRA